MERPAASPSKGVESVVTPNARSRVLVVDDDPAVLHMLDTACKRFGFATETAKDGREAIERVQGASFDVIISDIQMPGLSGIEFLRAVRERDLDVPVILMTGAPSVETASAAAEHGAFRYLAKPVVVSVLKEVLERAARLHDVARLKREALALQEDNGKWHGDRTGLEVRFGKAIDGLWVAFQPIIAWGERRVYGYEALVRTQEESMRNPLTFFDAAERLGRERELGRIIRARAAASAPPEGARLFVNLHPADLGDEELYSPTAPLAKLADKVVLEITERMSLDGVEDLDARIARLRALGYKVAVDDLGAGYAGLSSFTQLEPDVAKLDMSLIRDVHLKPKKQSIVRSLQRLCDELEIELVAEGVETREERDVLTSLGCDLFQGYLFAKPGPAFPVPDLT
jgi:EAL domain-containing protein (putative c-di-GMP-specific phosphodiesterase class I)/CheY-like chemotaxis protein